MLSQWKRKLRLVGFALGVSVLPPFANAIAQQPVIAKACVSPRPLSGSGPDSGKFLVSLKIVGVPELGMRNLGRIELVDVIGRSHAPFGFAPATDWAENTTLLASYTKPPTSRFSEAEFLFLIPQGLMSFELRIAGLKPMSVVPTMAAGSLRQCLRTA